jgi:serine/threonine-protein kinase
VAIKMIRSNTLSAVSVERFQAEAKAISILAHEYIAKVFEFGIAESGQPYLVMDYIEGDTLADVLRQQSVLQNGQFLDIFIQICEAMSCAHSLSILHRDIKPSNLMIRGAINEHPQVCITNFGIAKFLGDTAEGMPKLTEIGDPLGSPPYKSPEQVTGAKVDHRSDLYSLGCVMYESLTGAPPFSGGNSFQTLMMHVNDRPAPMREASLGKVINADLEAIVLRLLKKDPDDRYQNMDVLKRDLSSIGIELKNTTGESA